MQGAFATGVWVLAHECGHGVSVLHDFATFSAASLLPWCCILQAFSDFESVNDAVGIVFHSLLLVPYFSWCGAVHGHCASSMPLHEAPYIPVFLAVFGCRKHSHRRHHQNTGNLAKDEVFVPKFKPAESQLDANPYSPL
jgi:omega-6 fatty acid desaturase (delta-12 desaturase)